jgi:integrase
MTLFKRGNVYWYEFKHLGVRYRESTHTDDPKIAGRAERRRRKEAEEHGNKLEPVAKPILFSKAVKEFFENNDTWERRTRSIHENSWKHLKPHFGDKLLSDIKPLAIIKYRAARKAEGIGPRSINIEVSLIRLVLTVHDLWHDLKKQKFRMLKEPKDVGRALSHDEQHRILAAAKSSISRSLYPAILLSIHTGMRHQELRFLRWRQVDLMEGAVTVGKSKTEGGEGRVIPLSDTALACMKEWRSQFPDTKPHDYAFPTERYKQVSQKDGSGVKIQVYACDPLKPIAGWKTAWTTCRRNAGVTARWHDLRHTFISNMGENKVGEQTLMGMTGHLSRKMLELYSHPRLEAKREAVRTLDRLAESQPYPQNDPQQSAPTPTGIM